MANVLRQQAVVSVKLPLRPCPLLPCSGPTAYLDESVGYPLPIEGLVPVGADGGAFAGEQSVRLCQPGWEGVAWRFLV